MSGHGWVTPNPDGSQARCGGPALCGACAREKAAAEAAIAARLTGASSSGQQTAAAPAETMRRAAALMRERAQAVQHFTSPWHTAGPVESDEWRDQNDEWRVMYATDHPAAGLIATTADYGTWCLPDHIASWHPLVALAVADWLGTAADAAAYELTLDTPECTHDEPCRCERTPGWGCNRCAGWFPDSCHCWDGPLAVARAYLGEEAP